MIEGKASRDTGHAEEMSDTVIELLREIRQGLRKPETPISHLLRLALMLGQDLGAEDLNRWAESELEGYKNQEEAPPYRRIPASVAGDGQAGFTIIKGQLLPRSIFPKEIQDFIDNGCYLLNGILEIEEMASRGEDLKLGFPQSAEVAQYISSTMNDFSHIERVYWVTGSPNVAGVVDQVKTRLTKLVGTLMNKIPTGDSSPNSAQANAVLSWVINGDNAQISAPQVGAGASSNSNQSQGEGHQLSGSNTSSGPVESVNQIEKSTQSSPTFEATPSWWNRWRRPGTIALGIFGIIAAIAAVGQWLNWNPFL